MWRRSFLGLAALPIGLVTEGEAFAKGARVALREAYVDNVAALEARRIELAARHGRAKTEKRRASVLARAERTVLRALDEQLFPAWKGTAWDFNGTSTVPGSGHIACGYLVTTLLRDAGLRLERARLAQQPSERIVKTLCPAASIWRFRKGDVSAVAAATREEGAGLYVVGLDNHVGLLRVDADGVRFWHSSYVDPARVASEAPEEAAAFASNYHVVGRLFTPSLLQRWLEGASIVTVTA